MASGQPAGVMSDAGEQTRDLFSAMNPPVRTVALVDLRQEPEAHGCPGQDATRLFRLALQEIERSIRGQDRVCPFGTARVAVAFGADADVVSARTLAERLARALRQCVPPDRELQEAGSSGPFGTSESTPQGLKHRAHLATVIVDRAIGVTTSTAHPWVTASITATKGRGSTPITMQTLRRRTIVRCVIGGSARYGTRRDDIHPGGRGTILVVSPSRAPKSNPPGIAAVAASSIAEHLGYDVGTIALSCEEEPILDVRGEAVELAVLVVEGEREPVGDRATWTSSTWNVPAQLVTAFSARGIPVIAVGAGGAAGALANCVAKGATVLLDLDELEDVLSTGAMTLGSRDRPVDTAWDRIPRAIEALALLTASERRVLFYLTTGRSAQDIADEQVVSVTTVRSHIRSILRKLGVRSQLAAVAIANSQEFDRSPLNPRGVQRELEAPGVA